MTEQERDKHFKAIFMRNYEKLHLFATMMTGDSEQAKDVVSDVLGKAYEDYAHVLLSSVDSYLFLSTRNRCIDLLRHQQTHQKALQQFVQEQMTDSQAWNHYDERLDEVLDIISLLPEKTRYVMEECYLKDRTYQEVADMLQITPSGVKKHVMKGLDAIRNHFGVKYKKGQGTKLSLIFVFI